MQGLEPNFSEEPEINQVVINTELGLTISSIAGSSISSITLSGFNLTIKDLCMFTSQEKLENLNSAVIQDARLVNFKRHQFRNCDIGGAQNLARHVEVRLNCFCIIYSDTLLLNK